MADKKKKILLVDDEPDLLEVMEAILHMGGYDVIRASSGKEALKLAEAEHPDLILLDIKMPEMDGVQTTDLLRNHESTRDIRIVYLSNVVHDKEVVEGHVMGSKIGDLYFIPKTYKADKILEIVKHNLEIASQNHKSG